MSLSRPMALAALSSCDCAILNGLSSSVFAAATSTPWPFLAALTGLTSRVLEVVVFAMGHPEGCTRISAATLEGFYRGLRVKDRTGRAGRPRRGPLQSPRDP